MVGEDIHLNVNRATRPCDSTALSWTKSNFDLSFFSDSATAYPVLATAFIEQARCVKSHSIEILSKVLNRLSGANIDDIHNYFTGQSNLSSIQQLYCIPDDLRRLKKI